MLCDQTLGLQSQADDQPLRTTESIKIRDPLTGELREYHSTDEVPEPFRDQIRKLRESAASTESKTVITVTNSSGKLQTYHSVDELPPELRASTSKRVSERAKGSKDSLPNQIELPQHVR